MSQRVNVRCEACGAWSGEFRSWPRLRAWLWYLGHALRSRRCRAWWLR